MSRYRYKQIIRDAINPLLAGSPLYSTGKLTVKSLAEEARVKRWPLTHRHTDLQEEFRAKVEQCGRVPQAVQALRAENTDLEERVTKLAGEVRQERETVKRLERVVYVLALQLEQQRQATPNAQVHPLR